MQMLVPRYLEVSIDSLTREQEKFREQMSQAFGVGGFGADRGAGAPEHGNVRAHLRDVRAVRAAGQAARARPSGQGRSRPRHRRGGEIDDLKRQIDEMQKRIERIGDKDK